MDDILDSKSLKEYVCEKCHYICYRKYDYKKHVNTQKHMGLHYSYDSEKKIAKSYFNCKCGKEFKYRQGLWKHKQICLKSSNQDIEINNDINNNIDNLKNNLTDKDLIMLLLKENKEFKELIMNQSSKMMELATKPSTINNTNNNNCNNKHFNLNVFLNETCKNAMNINDFVSSLQIVSEDFEDIGKLGYIQGISNIFIKGLKELDETIRPMHCTDKKRETLYIKDMEGWNKDNNKDKIKTVIKEIADKNVKYIPIWQEDNPSYFDGTTKKNDQYMRIVNQVMTAIVPDEPNGLNKIIKNVANEICIDKDGESL